MGRREGGVLFCEFVPSPGDPSWDVGRWVFYFVSLFPHWLTPRGMYGGGVLVCEIVPSPADPSWDVGRERVYPISCIKFVDVFVIYMNMKNVHWQAIAYNVPIRKRKRQKRARYKACI